MPVGRSGADLNMDPSNALHHLAARVGWSLGGLKVAAQVNGCVGRQQIPVLAMNVE